jgi:hypothetical protein
MEKDILTIFKESKSKSDVCKKLGYHINGTGFRKVHKLIDEHNIDISHFGNGSEKLMKYERITKKCPVCESEFETKKNHKREKTTCSYACANSYFRSGENNPNYRDINDYDTDTKRDNIRLKYRKICFDNHQHKCVVCDEKKVLDVHHFDENYLNNEPDNLIPMCATHHNYLRSPYKGEVEPIVIKYRENFLKNRQ